MSYKSLHLDPDENVILEVRKHWIIFLGHALGLLFAAFIPLLIFLALEIYFPSALNIEIPGNSSALFLFFYTLWLLALWVSFFIDWTKYYLDVWYVTEKRIIITDQKHLFDREISNVRFDRIQDVSISVEGFIPTLLGFGNIKVQTASEDSKEFSMTVVRHPENVRKVIFSQHNEISDKEKAKL